MALSVCIPRFILIYWKNLAACFFWEIQLIILMHPILCSPKVTSSSAVAEVPHDVLCQLKSCQLPRNSAETTCMTSPEQIEVMKLEG